MASSVQSIGDEHGPFEVDSTERAHTIVGRPGGRVSNVDKAAGGGAVVYLEPRDAAVTTGDGGSIPIPVGTSYQLPRLCWTFRVKTISGNSYIVIEK